MCLCLFFSDSSYSASEFEAILSDIGRIVEPTMDTHNGILNQLVIVVPDTEVYCEYSIKPFPNELRKRFSDSTESQSVVFLLYNGKGRFRFESLSKLDCQVVEGLINEVKVYGLFEIFENGYGILDSGPGHHYVLQNGFHSDKFIRTANVLNDSSQIDFIALYLLQFIDDSDEVMYLDTSSITCLAYSVNKFRTMFGATKVLKSVSFSSYEGLGGVATHRYKAKYIISASTSGKLAIRLMRSGVEARNIITLFYLNSSASKANVICDLSKFLALSVPENIKGKYRYFTIQSESSCEFCRNSSYPINIVGEQFLPERFKVDTFSFDLSDRPMWLTSFLSKKHLFVKDAIVIYYGDSGQPKRDLYIHFDLIFRKYFLSSEKFKRFTKSRLPSKVDVVVYYSDNGTKELIREIEKFYQGTNANFVVESELDEKKHRGKSFLVVSATLTNGRRFVEASLRLRNLSPCAIHYFVAYARTPDELTINTTAKYVGFDQKFGKDVNPLSVVESIFISDIGVNANINRTVVSAWQEEFVMLKGIRAVKFKERFQLLESGGLSDNLFWDSPVGKKLKLRSNFAFFRGVGSDIEEFTTQAQVYFVINSVLHNLRQNSAKAIFQSPFHRHILSPETFIMYNDGVVQACILRAATSIELNYNLTGENFKIGNEMVNVLKYIFRNFENEIGEATTEFLIALWTRRLQIIRKDLYEIICQLKVSVEKSSVVNKRVITELCRRILNDFNT